MNKAVMPEKPARRTRAIHPTRFVLRSTREIPPRQWLYGRHLIRGFLSLTVAPGGVGKSSLALVEALAMVSGRDLLGDHSPAPLRVWYWNGEDPRDEIERRIASACQQYKISAEEIGDRLLADSGRDVPITLAETIHGSFMIPKQTVDALIDAIKAKKVDVLIIDPFVTSHQAPENDSTAMNAVVSTWRTIADITSCAIELVHHTNKAGAINDDQGVYSSRGAGAVIDGVRSARYLTRMKKEEAEKYGIEDPTAYFRVNPGKTNLAPPEKATWRKMIGVPLNNGRDLWKDGDIVGVCMKWSPPDAFEGMSLGDLQRVQQAIDKVAVDLKHNERSNEWVGYVIADALDLDLGCGLAKEDRSAAQNGTRARVRNFLRTWIKSGALIVDEIHDARAGRYIKVVRVGEHVTSADITCIP